MNGNWHIIDQIWSKQGQNLHSTYTKREAKQWQTGWLSISDYSCKTLESVQTTFRLSLDHQNSLNLF